MNILQADHSAFPFNIRFKLIGVLLGVIFCQNLLAQGWQLDFGGRKLDEGQAVIATKDEGFVIAGYSESFGGDNDLDVFVVRTDVDGAMIWSEIFDEGFREFAYTMLEDEDGSIFILGSIQETESDEFDVYLLKISPNGKFLWSKRYGSDAVEQGLDLEKTSDGGFIISGFTTNTADGEDDVLLIKIDSKGNEMWSTVFGDEKDDRGVAVLEIDSGYIVTGNSDNPSGFDNDIVLYRLDKSGEKIWSKRIASDENEEVSDLIATRDGAFVIAGKLFDNSDAYIAKFDIDGNQLWSKTFGGQLGDAFTAVSELPDGSLVAAGFTEENELNTNILLVKLDSTGEQQWSQSLGREGGDFEMAEDIAPIAKGGFVLAGSSGNYFSNVNDMFLVKTDSQGNTKTNFITGSVFRDSDGLCSLDLNDLPLEGWIVKAEGENGTFFGTSDENGHYRILVDTGNYQVNVLPVNSYWKPCVEEGYSVELANFYDTTTLDFPILEEIACPYLQVDVSTPFLATCSDIRYTVQYCNLGTSEAEEVDVEVELDADLAFISSSIPFSSQEGPVYTFQLGNVGSTECGSFEILTSLPCSGIATGQAGLVTARVFPDTLCADPDPNWDGASVRVRGDCTLDKKVQFRIRNQGRAAMQESRKFYVIEQDVILFQQPFELESGQDTLIKIDNRNGATYRLIAEQTSFHPFTTFSTAVVEGCVEPGQAYAIGQVVQFPESDNRSPFIAVDVQETIDAENPVAVAMKGYPKGYRDSIIATDTDLEYLITFSNIGSDTIRRVVIRDTLSAFLDITTVIPGASNFPYEFEVYDNGIVKITFNDLELLPGGSEEEAKSYGFIKFNVSQKPDVPVGTPIENRAALYLGYYAPVQTNTVRHVIGGTFPGFVELLTSENEVFVPGVKIKVYPNPFLESTVFEVEGKMFDKLTFRLFDSAGKLLKTEKVSGNQFVIYRNQLSPGMYFYRVESEGKVINTGKLLAR